MKSADRSRAQRRFHRCPRRDVWRDFTHGRLPEGSLDPLSAHLDACHTCLELVTALEQEGDSVVDLVLGSFEQQKAQYQNEAELLELTHSLLTDPAQMSRWSRTQSGTAGPVRLPPAIPRTVDEYELIEPLGAGAAGRVYKAVHRRLRKTVSLKLLSPRRRLTEDLVLRFEREMQAVGQIDHPNVIAATDAGQAEGFYFLAMEYAPGLDLGEIGTRLGRLRLADACEMVRQAALGVQAAHEHGLIHRDIKPSNLLLTDEGTVKVLDLGLVALSGLGKQRRMRSGRPVGTPHYMAPEQWEGYPADVAADIYSLGCTLFRLLAGRAPFDHVSYNHRQIRRAHCRRAPEMTALGEDVPREVTDIVARSLAKNSRTRFATAADLAAALADWTCGADLAGCVAESRAFSLKDTLHSDDRDTAGETAGRILQSRWRWRAIGGTLVLLLAGGGVWSLLPARDLPRWEVKIPAGEEPLFSQAGRNPQVAIRPVGAADELVINAGGRTLLQAGDADDHSYSLRTTVSLNPNERAGLFFGATLFGANGLSVGLVEVFCRPSSAGEETEYIVSVRHLYHNVENPIAAAEINRNLSSTSVRLPAEQVEAALELHASPNGLEVFFDGRQAIQVSRTEWRQKTANEAIRVPEDFAGPFGFYVLRGKVEFSHLRFFNR